MPSPSKYIRSHKQARSRNLTNQQRKYRESMASSTISSIPTSYFLRRSAPHDSTPRTPLSPSSLTCSLLPFSPLPSLAFFLPFSILLLLLPFLPDVLTSFFFALTFYPIPTSNIILQLSDYSSPSFMREMMIPDVTIVLGAPGSCCQSYRKEPVIHNTWKSSVTCINK